MAKVDMTQAMEEYAQYYDQGLRKKDFVFATEPRVVPHDLTVDLPHNMSPLYDDHAYGTVEEFIRYIREVNGIPVEAQQWIEYEVESRINRVKFTWYIVNGWTLAQENVFTHGM